MTTTHFVSKSCGGEKCVCGKPAMHKLGEEIMFDEPCMACGETWRYISAGGTREVTDPGPCHDMYHHFRGANRHNLTSYVCCFHWTLILGAATGCPLDDNNKRALDLFKYACDQDHGFGPPVELRCTACRGPLKVEGANPTNVVIGCTACGIGHYVENKDKPDAPG